MLLDTSGLLCYHHRDERQHIMPSHFSGPLQSLVSRFWTIQNPCIYWSCWVKQPFLAHLGGHKSTQDIASIGSIRSMYQTLKRKSCE